MDILNDAKRIAFEAKNKKLRTENMKKAFEKKTHDVLKWSAENADLLVAVAPFIVCGTRALVSGAKMCHRTRTLKKEKDLKERYCYDRSLGHYWELRRKLTNREWNEVDKRRRAGEKLGEILSEMKVLK